MIDEITKLIEDLKAAEEGSRELDVRIHSILNPDDEIIIHHYENTHEIGLIEVIYPDGESDLDEIHPFSGSIDAAMTTIREGYEVLEMGMRKGAGFCRLKKCSDNRPKDLYTASDIYLAICIASLSAMLEEAT